MGERTPHLDPDCRGAFIGLSAIHTKYDMLRAVMEGVTFSQRDSVEVLKGMGVSIDGMLACGGGGIPVINRGGKLVGVSAVIDKDNVSSLLASKIGADYLVILTAVEKVAINFGKENQEWLSDLTVEQAKKYIAEEQFAKGSMLPKIEAAVRFAESGEGRRTLITLLEKAADGIAGKTGTVIHK